MSRLVRVGIIGAGAIVRQRHAPGLMKIPGVDIVAVANAREETARAFCQEWAPRAAVLADWREVPRRPEVDAVLIGAGPFLHEPATVAALEAGKHVFCQARMATDLAAARRMLQAAQAHPELVTMLCPPPHGLRADAFVRSLLAAGRLGEVRQVSVRARNSLFLDPAAPPHWRQRWDISGKNVLTLGIWAEVLQRWFGRMEPQRARGFLYVRERAGYAVRIPDAIEVQGRLEAGPTFVMELSGAWPGPAEDAAEIVGSQAVLRVDASGDRLELAEGGGPFRELAVPSDFDRPWSVEEDFIAAVRNPAGPRPRPNFEDGVAYMEVVERVWELMGGDSGF